MKKPIADFFNSPNHKNQPKPMKSLLGLPPELKLSPSEGKFKYPQKRNDSKFKPKKWNNQKFKIKKWLLRIYDFQSCVHFASFLKDSRLCV